MIQALAFEQDRADVEKYIQDNGGTPIAVFIDPDRANVVVGQYRDSGGKQCEIIITVSDDNMYVGTAVREAMIRPTMLAALRPTPQGRA